MNFNIRGFKVTLTFPAVALIAFVVISNFATGYLLSFLAIFVHELGHIFAMMLCKCVPDGLQISAFDIKIIRNHRFSIDFSKDIIITVFGALFNFIFFLMFLYLNKTFAFVNLFVGIFNLLPTSNLDGGQLLFLFLNRKITANVSSKIVDGVTIALSCPMFILGILVLLNSKYNFSLLFISIYLILSLFMKKDKIL